MIAVEREFNWSRSTYSDDGWIRWIVITLSLMSASTDYLRSNLIFLYFRYLHRRWVITLALHAATCVKIGKSGLLTRLLKRSSRAVTCKWHLESFASLISAFCVSHPARDEPEKNIRRGASIFSSACKLDGRVYVGIFWGSHMGHAWASLG